jgi:hypothetical protein
MIAGVTSPTGKAPRCGWRYRSKTERVWRMVVGAHDATEMANHASNRSETRDFAPIAPCEPTEATNAPSARSALPRLPRTVEVR